MHQAREVSSACPIKSKPIFLLASHHPALLAAVEPVLLDAGAPVQIVLSLEAALDSILAADPPALLLLDADLPAMEPGMDIERLLAAARGPESPNGLPIVLIADSVSQTWIDGLAEGVIDDLIPRTAELSYWRVRIEMALRNRHGARELETLREAQLLNARMDHLTGVYNRETVLTMLFRETDRVQRMNSPLCLVLFDIDDFGHWNMRLGAEACDELLSPDRGSSDSACCAATICWAVPARTNFCSAFRVAAR